METESLNEAELELVCVCSEHAAGCYKKGQLSKAAHYAEKIIKYAPDDPYALFIKGAVIGRSSKPDKLQIQEAFDIWKPLAASLDKESREVLLSAIDSTFALMTNTPIELGIRQWDVYHNEKTAQTLARVLKTYGELADSLVENRKCDAWIESLFEKNYTHWVLKAVGPSMAIPAQCETHIVDAFYDMVKAAYEIAKRIPAGTPNKTARARALDVLVRFEKLNGSAQHQERRTYLNVELATFDILNAVRTMF